MKRWAVRTAILGALAVLVAGVTTASAQPGANGPTRQSYVLAGSTTNGVPDTTALRSCARQPLAGETTACQASDRLPDYTTILMGCWEDNPYPPKGMLPRWFYVTELNGPHPGWSGYVYAPLVRDQITVPVCTDAVIAGITLHVTLTQGPPAPAGFWYTITVEHHLPNRPAVITCADSVSEDGFKTFTLAIDTAGHGSSTRDCYSGDGEHHWATADGYGSSWSDWTATPRPAISPSPQAVHPTQGPSPQPSLPDRNPDTRPPPTVELAEGPAAPAGYRYAITLRAFPPNSAVSVTCFDTTNPAGFFTFPMNTDAAGSAFTQSYCYSGDGPDHWTRASGVESNHVAWIWSPLPTPPPPDNHPTFTVQNTSETAPDGVWFRNSPRTADTNKITGLGVYMNEQVQLQCYAWGDAVGAYNNQVWYRVTDTSRPTNNGQPNTGYLNAHYINDGTNANQLVTGVPAC